MTNPSDFTPFRGKHIDIKPATRVIGRFMKPGGNTAVIRERKVTQFAALEWMLVIDGQMIETRMYHGARLPAYVDELRECREHLIRSGWQPAEEATDSH